MRKINNVVRTKNVYNLSVKEFKSGEWLKTIPESDKLEISYKNNFLVVKDMKNKSEKEEQKWI